MTEEQKQKCEDIIKRYNAGEMDVCDAVCAVTDVEPRLLAFQAFNIVLHEDYPDRIFERRR